jgi:SAM-dependent methyltransferase
VRCEHCDFLFLSPQPSEEILKKNYGSDYFFGSSSDQVRNHIALRKNSTAESYLDLLNRKGIIKGRLLEVGCGDGYLLRAAERQGFEVVGIEYSEHAAQKAREGLIHGQVVVGELQSANLPNESFDVCVLADVIEHVSDPRAFLESAWLKLKIGACILIATPSTDSWSARLMGSRWMEFKTEHMSYFSHRTLESLLWQTGFQSVHMRAANKIVSLHYIVLHFAKYPIPLWSYLVEKFSRLLPSSSLDKYRSIAGSGVLALATKGSRSERPLLSIIVPAYNEEATIGKILGALTSKEITGMDKEIIVVESNSTDATRKIVQQYEASPGFQIILEDRPQGKGAATRKGLKAARGDVILIQDADLEYDLEDYDLLLDPIVSGRAAFVLGARHGGRSWKIRHFSDQPLHAFLLNTAHWGFTLMINLSLGIWLRDPFTMYKVFRRDCMHGLTFECNRFDFDWELLIKLIRKGYRPIEIPVNYRSRSFKEGKKIRMIRDPLSWIPAWAKARFGSLY